MQNLDFFHYSKLVGFNSFSDYDNLYLIDMIASFIESLQVCTIVNCIKGKQTNKSIFKANRILDISELIHTYICGLFLTALVIVNNIL